MTSSWENAWKEGRTGWDAGGSPPILTKLVEAGEMPAGRVLVPGCGSGYDAFTLSGNGRRSVGLDLAPSAAERFQLVRESLGISEEDASIIVGDFFEFESGDHFDLVWDYTFLCALPRELREAWAARMAAIIKPGGSLVCLVFPVDPTRPVDQGPPFPLTPDLVAGLLAKDFEAVSMEKVEVSNPGREGKEWLGRWTRT